MMPVTPFHFGPCAYIALLLNKYIDFPVFILINCIIDIEPFIVIVFNLPYSAHGYSHTFLIGTFVGVLSTIFFYSERNYLKKLMNLLHLPYETNFRKMLISAILGVWFHILLDMPLYHDIKPFYPFTTINPLYGKIRLLGVYLICSILFIPAFLLYKKQFLKQSNN